jgi:class 3 adenylate cyclase/tetratricopeptide (TPR) repeat protein
MESLAAYVPIDRRQVLARGGDLPNRTWGVVLFTDISGFTPLTDALVAALGHRRGAEELTGVVNLVYEALITEVHRYGGSVVGFSGDAITCCFNQAPPGLASQPVGAQAELRATACALALQQAMQRFAETQTPSGVDLSLAVKAALASGPLRRFRAGDPEIQYMDVLAGSTLDRMATAEGLAVGGEVVIGAEVAAELGGRAELAGWRVDPQTGDRFAVVAHLAGPIEVPNSESQIEVGALTEAQTRPWLLPPIYERLKAGQEHYLAELRTGVALFLRFGGLDYDNDDAAGEKLDTYIRWVQRTLAHYEGYLIQLTSGDKGSYLYAAFGAPLAHGDDAARAVAAALRLQSPPPELGFVGPVQIGLSQGRMRVGPYGSQTRRTYGALGGEVNMAARLMSKAKPGQILISKHVAEAAGRSFRFHPLEEVRVKGRQNPVPVFGVSARRPSVPGGTASTIELPYAEEAIRAPQGAIVGRTVERQMLADQLNSLLRGGDGGLVVIEGEPGIGKSRLVAHLLEEAAASGATSLVGAGDALEISIPYHAWRPIFRQIFGPNPGADLEPAHVLSRLPNDPESLNLAPLLNAVLPLGLPDNDVTSQMIGEVRAENTNEFLARLLQATVTETPTVLVLEDAHWHDSASWALTRLVSRRVKPLLLVVTTRPLDGPMTRDYNQLLETPNTTRLELGTLPPDQVVALVGQRLGVEAVPEPVADLIRARAGGHPLFSEELAYALREEGLIQVEDGKCRVVPDVSDLSAVGLPDTIEGMITSRVDRLSPAQQMTLKVASVIGRGFAYSTLRDIHPIQDYKPQMPAHLVVAERRDIGRLETPEPDLAYIFKHVIAQEVIYNTLLYAQRRDLHCAVAEWLEGAHADDLSRVYPLLAYHWDAAGDAAKTIDYTEKAGEQALLNYSNREAVTFFSKALELDARRKDGAPSPRLRRARWHRGLGDAYYGLGEMPKSREHLKKALALLHKPEPPGRGLLIAGLLWQVLTQVMHRRWPGGFSVRSEKPDEGLVEAARSYYKLSLAYHYSGQLLPAQFAVFAGLNLAESAGAASQLTEELARGYAMAGSTVGGGFRMHAAADNYFRMGREIAQQHNHLPAEGWTWQIEGHIRSIFGQWERADECLARARDIFERLGDGRHWEEVVWTMSESYYMRGEFVRSQRLAEDHYASARRRDDAQSLITALGNRSLVFLAQGQADQAASLLKEAQELLAGRDYPAEHVLTHGLMAVTNLRQGDRTAALRAARTAADMIPNVPNGSIALAGYAGVAETCLTLWGVDDGLSAAQRDELAHLARQGITAFRRTSRQVSPIHQPQAGLYQGWYDWLSGKHTRAHKTWCKCLAEAERLGTPYTRGRIEYAIARHLDATDPVRAEHLAGAREVFRLLGATYDLAQVVGTHSQKHSPSAPSVSGWSAGGSQTM